MWNKPTPEELAEIPRIHETESMPLKDKVIYMHFFIADCDWYIAEYDGEDLFWGFCHLGDDLNAEWGYVSLEELENTKVQGFVEIDRDLDWKERPACEIPKIARCPNSWPKESCESTG